MRCWGGGGASLRFAQVGEISVRGGVSRFGGASLGTTTDASGNPLDVAIKNGFRLGAGTTKFGVNGGAGVNKMRITPIIVLRFDLREYNTGKPFKLAGQSGRLNQLVSVRASFLF